MAYRKKGAKSASRRSYRRRYTRRRRYRRKFYRSRNRRFPRGTEVKSVSKQFSGYVKPTIGDVEETITYKPGYCTIIGEGEDWAYGIPIEPGTSMSQRVGAKVEPVKLRISGCFSLENSLSITGNAQLAPNFWQVRCIVYQVKGGNAAAEPDESGYHQMAMETTDGFIRPKSIRKLLYAYWNDGNIADDLQRYNFNQWNSNNNLAKVPLRRGIGGQCRVLYKKSFWVNSQKNPIKQFRFITKLPKRFVYPETMDRGNNNNTLANANNCIYIVWLFQPGSFAFAEVPILNFSYSVDLFYTDK